MKKRGLPQLPKPQFDYLPFRLGLDLVTPVIQTVPGSCREAQNYEIDIVEGYKRFQGYERFDGQAKPSDAQYATLDVTISGSVSVGNTITGATSSATAVVIAVVTSGVQDYLAITKITGTFQDAEDLEVSSVVQANTDSTASIDGATTAQLHAQYRNLAADEYRADIAAVPGSGKVLGVWMLDDIKYAFRNNVGGTAADLHKSSASGWTAVPLGLELPFTSGGTIEILEGQTIIGAVSRATAVLTRVMLESGSWAAGTAAGKFIFASKTGNFQSETIDVGANTNLATIAGNATAITILPGGRYEFITRNFGGQTGADRIYGCDSVNRGFEFDGSVFCPITTGMTVDTPTHVHAFKNHLFFSFAGSAQHSGIGVPYSFTIITGAGELAVGDTITAFKEQPGSEGNASLAMFSRNRIHMLYGTSVADWNLVQYREEVGAYAYSVQEFGMTMMLDDRGVANLLTVQAFGNFQHNSLSRLIQPWVNERKTLINASCIARDKSQYRLFFSDKYALFVTTNNRKVIGMMPMLFEHTVECIFSLEASDGSEEIIFGSDNGFVYQMEKGTSFDGDSMNHYLVLHFHHSKSPRVKKGYKSIMLEAEGLGYAEFDFTYELGYNTTDLIQPGTETKTLNFASARWDSFIWDAFFWDGETLSPANLKLRGSAENISIIIRGDSDYFVPIRFSGALIRFIQRRHMR